MSSVNKTAASSLHTDSVFPILLSSCALSVALLFFTHPTECLTHHAGNCCCYISWFTFLESHARAVWRDINLLQWADRDVKVIYSSRVNHRPWYYASSQKRWLTLSWNKASLKIKEANLQASIVNMLCKIMRFCSCIWVTWGKKISWALVVLYRILTCKLNSVFQMFVLQIKQSLKSTSWKKPHQIDIHRI